MKYLHAGSKGFFERIGSPRRSYSAVLYMIKSRNSSNEQSNGVKRDYPLLEDSLQTNMPKAFDFRRLPMKNNEGAVMAQSHLLDGYDLVDVGCGSAHMLLLFQRNLLEPPIPGSSKDPAWLLFCMGSNYHGQGGFKFQNRGFLSEILATREEDFCVTPQIVNIPTNFKTKSMDVMNVRISAAAYGSFALFNYRYKNSAGHDSVTSSLYGWGSNILGCGDTVRDGTPNLLLNMDLLNQSRMKPLVEYLQARPDLYILSVKSCGEYSLLLLSDGTVFFFGSFSLQLLKPPPFLTDRKSSVAADNGLFRRLFSRWIDAKMDQKLQEYGVLSLVPIRLSFINAAEDLIFLHPRCFISVDMQSFTLSLVQPKDLNGLIMENESVPLVVEDVPFYASENYKRLSTADFVISHLQLDFPPTGRLRPIGAFGDNGNFYLLKDGWIYQFSCFPQFSLVSKSQLGNGIMKDDLCAKALTVAGNSIFILIGDKVISIPISDLQNLLVSTCNVVLDPSLKLSSLKSTGSMVVAY